MAKDIPTEIAMIPNWGDIPMDIAYKIRKHIELYDDYEAFSEVCSSWRLSTKEFQYINRKQTQLPWLMLADEADSSYRRYYSLTKQGFLKIYNPPSLSPPQPRRYFSSRGWLLSVSRNISSSNGLGTYFNITIFNPFSNNNVIIEAPLFHLSDVDASEWEDKILLSHFQKFAISTCPNNAEDSDDDFVVAMIFGENHNLAYWRPGHNDTWVVPNQLVGLLEDLCFFRGELYAIQYHGVSVCWVIAFGDLKDRKHPWVFAELGDLANIYQLPPNMVDCVNRYYMVESKHHSSCLLVIHRYMAVESYDERKINTVSFNVLKLNADNLNLESVKSLGNQMIFVGFNSTFSVNVDDFGGKSDCIYYTDDYWERYIDKKEGGGKDMGIYSLPQGNILPFYEGPSQFSVINPPFWIEFSECMKFQLGVSFNLL